jgi:prenyltransferase beta subunit
MSRISRIVRSILILSIAVPFAGSALAKEKAKVKGGDFDFTKTSAFMREMETRPDFPVAMVLANDYVYSLFALGAKIDAGRQHAVIACIQSLQQKDGGFVADKAIKSASILYTDSALETLGLLNVPKAIDAARVKMFVAGLKNPDGGFGFSQESKRSSLATTYFAVHVLKGINGLDLVDKAKTAAYVKGYEKKDGGFGAVKGAGIADARNTYMAAYVLNTLGMLDNTSGKKAVKFLGTTPYGGSKAKAMPDLNEQYFAIKALKELNAADKIDRKFATAFMKRLYIEVNGGFGPLEGYGSTPDSTATGLRVLAELDKLKGVHVKAPKTTPQIVTAPKPMHNLSMQNMKH